MSTTEELGPLVSTRSSWEVTRPLVHTCIAFIVLDTVIVLAKTFSRVQLAKLRFWWDDFWVLVAYASLVPIGALALVMVNLQTSWDDQDRIIVNLDQLEKLLKIIYALLPLLFASYAATRYAILALYLRIFSEKKLRIAIWAVVGFVTVQWLGFTVQAFLQCHPVQYYWNKRIEGSCVDVDKFYRAITPFNIIVDLVVIILPLTPIWKLQASRTRKWALSFLFGVGIMALIASAIRLRVYTTHSAKRLAPSYTNIMIIWLIIEPSIYLIAACMPAMHHIYVALIPSRVRNWMSMRMARFGSTILGRSSNRGGGNMTLISEGRDITDNDERGLHLELGNAPGSRPAKSSAHAGRGEGGVDWRMLNKGIVVTKEVHVTYTEEERIERVIGF